MFDKDVETFKNIANRINNLNAKIKLIALLEKARYEYQQNNYSECENSCRQILKTNPKNSIALRGLGCVMQAKNNYKKALEYYNLALEFSENKEIEYTLIGMIYYLEENLDEAIKHFNFAIEINDNYDPAYEGRNQSMLENHLKIADLQDQLIRQKIF
ncbi:MAG: tetratricopeptide repeat protein [Cyanobacteria bacterium SIG31]|nr:tetratricopeptide repeat protein [Cyanobacteria bacterium SIG31]